MRRIQSVNEANLELRRAHQLQKMLDGGVEWFSAPNVYEASKQNMLGDVIAAKVSKLPNIHGRFDWSVTDGYSLEKQGSSATIEEARQASEAAILEGN